MKKLNQDGYHVLLVVLIIIVIGVIGVVGWRVLGKKNNSSTKTGDEVNTQQPQTETSSENITWEWNGEKWQASGTPPKCPNPLVFKKSPVDVKKATAILYPGQTRGGDYKPHGGFRFDGVKDNKVTVVTPMDAKLVQGSRYIENGEIQILLEFVNDCGIAFRFDHILDVSPALQAAVDSLPAAKQDDSRTTKFTDQVSVKEGDEIASSIGFKNTGNVSVDFGVYDYRQLNSAAQNSSYASKHKDELSQAGYAVCWFDILPSADASLVKNLPGGDSVNGKTSDYCK